MGIQLIANYASGGEPLSVSPVPGDRFFTHPPDLNKNDANRRIGHFTDTG